MKNRKKKTLLLPVLVLRNLVLLPKAVLPVKVHRKISINAVSKSLEQYNGEVFVVFQQGNSEDIDIKKLDKNGVVAKIFEVFEEKDASLKILIEGLYRAKSQKIAYSEIESENNIIVSDLSPVSSSEDIDIIQKEAYLNNIKLAFKDFVGIGGDKISASALKIVKEANNLDFLIDFVAASIDTKNTLKIELLNEESVFVRAEKLYSFLINEVEIDRTEKNIRKRVHEQIEKHQKDYYLNEQVRAIYKELGREDVLQEVNNFRLQAEKIGLSAEGLEKVQAECKRLEQIPFSSPEAAVCRSYIEWILALPWQSEATDNVDLSSAKKILNQSHAGMQKAKETIFDYIVAKKFAKASLKNTQVLCLAGPPGVGKTTLAESIAKTLGRPFIRISLGGVRDEAEIRGHRKTYIASMPGKIIAAMRKSKVINPVILLDEIDKMSGDFRGDPAAALLEVLDPEQNKSFMDHFLEIGYDLSKVLFIATANLCENIPGPLLDRMEIVSLSGYTEQEKLQIADNFLLPKIFEDHALKNNQLRFEDGIIKKIITEYTREAGVRQLGRILTRIVRRSIAKLLEDRRKKANITVSDADVRLWLGYPKFKNHVFEDKFSVGVVTGLAWTEVGGDILEIEVVKMKGKGNLSITGQLGEVMQESAQAALSFIKSMCKEFGIKESIFTNIDLHIHIPEGATPKDGPSAGIALATALVSVLSGSLVNRELAMSGEITLQGRVLPVGGLKEKILAATRFGIKTVLVPVDNEQEVLEILKDLVEKPEVIFVKHITEVLSRALLKDGQAMSFTSEDNFAITEKRKNLIIPSVRARPRNKGLRIASR